MSISNSKLKEKQWTPKIEEEIIDYWFKNKIFKFNKDTKKPVFAIDTPPPYCSGAWHIGGAIHYSQIDMIARYMRMSGYEVHFPMATDRNGLPIEVQVEKAYGIAMHSTPRDKFIQLCKEFLDKYEEEILELAKRLGLSCHNFDNIIRTDSPEYRAVTQATFIELWKRGLIYEDYRPNNWCPGCKTTIADAEVEYIERETYLNYIKFKIENSDEDLIIATTRPELLAACAAVIVHPDDSRYKHLHGKYAITPIYNKRVKIVPHKEAKMEFGSGAAMICSYGDYTDVRLFRELKLKPIVLITPEGTLSEKAGKYAGLTVEEARRRIIEDLKSQGLLIKQEKILQRTPICWRSKDPIEFIPMKEFYLKQIDFVDDIRKIADEIKFLPPESKQILLNWLDSISTDWPISRRRYYGTEIPIWYCKNCGKPVLPEPGRYYQPWKEKPPFDKCPYCGSTDGFEGEWRTFDTWMDSSITAIEYIGYMRDDELFRKAFQNVLRPQGKDIVRTWLYYTLLRVYQLTNRPAFKYVWISGMVVDEKGEAMHKSKGNIVWPKPLIEKYGSDALRLFGCLEASLGSDIRYSEDRLRGAFKFLTKLWNIARFISAFSIPKEKSSYELQPTDKWILGLLNEVIKKAKSGYDNLNFHIPAVEVRNFVWNIFADHYIEMVKPRAYNRNGEFDKKEQNAAWYTLHTVLKTVLKLLAPIIPMITEKIYLELYHDEGESIHLSQFPTPVKDWETDLIEKTNKIIEINSEIWKLKKKHKMSLKESLSEVWMPEELSIFKKDLKEMHHIEKLNFGKPENIEQYDKVGESLEIYIRRK